MITNLYNPRECLTCPNFITGPQRTNPKIEFCYACSKKQADLTTLRQDLGQWGSLLDVEPDKSGMYTLDVEEPDIDWRTEVEYGIIRRDTAVRVQDPLTFGRTETQE